METHNHHLTPVNHVHHMPEYQVLFDLDKAQVDSLHSFGSRTCQIMGYLLAKKGRLVKGSIGPSLIKVCINYIYIWQRKVIVMMYSRRVTK